MQPWNNTRPDFIVALATRFPKLMATDAGIAVKEILAASAHSMARGDRVEVLSYASFSLNCRAPRAACNPKSGKKVSIPAKHVPHITPGKEMRECVAQPVMPKRIKEAA